MNRYKTIFGISAAGILILGVLAYTQLEIYQRTEPVSPSHAVRSNNFYAMEKWLARTGHPVRIDSQRSSGRLILEQDRAVYIQASLFDWQYVDSILTPWIQLGASLLISLESGWYDEDEDFADFLESIGVQAELWNPEDEEDDDEDTVILRDAENYPDFDSDFCFSLIEDFDFDDPPLLLNDDGGVARLVTVPLGQGSITVTGQPYFMYNYYLEKEENARLAWELTAAKTEDEQPGVLFIRGRWAVKSLFGKLAERGNPLPLIVSALVLVLAGFWMVIPGFGILRAGDERRTRPIRDRFRAETRFLKKYHALDSYLELYLREIKNKYRDRKTDPRVEEIERSLGEKKNRTNGEIIRDLKILETIMEHL
ncbi:hypothetical protein FACS1894140_2480 [Spirochaetia bacterium]|nr:hypothetical protein FACS1894140_2480 [Spirochaetia bacterium]